MNDEFDLIKQENERYKAMVDILLKENQQLNNKISLLMANGGQGKAEPSHQNIHDGNMQALSSLIDVHNGKDIVFPSLNTSLEGKININTSHLAQLVRKEMSKSRYAGTKHVAILLVHLYTHPTNTHKHLATLTDMTLSGIAKHIHMLKKRGFIVRSAFQTYTLTPKSFAWLQQAQQQTPAAAE